MDWKIMLPILITGISPILDGVIKGERLNSTQQKMVQQIYSAALIWGEDAVNNTETDLDNQGLEAFKALCEDTAKEGDFPLLVLAMVE